MDTVAKGEVAAASLTAFIATRDKQRRRDEGERPAEALYAESARRYEERRQRARLWEWYRYHQGQIQRHTATLEALVSAHRKEAQRYAALLGAPLVEPVELDETIERSGHQENGHEKGA